jgi:hypothetical protein
MSEIVYTVHRCLLPEYEGLGIGSVWKCDCEKLFELTYYPGVPYIHSAPLPSHIAWTALAPRWFDEATQTPTPKHLRIIDFPVITRKTKWQRFIALIKGEQK